jgi:DNA repair exonuclease SbcCD ATPase subunit
MSDLSVVIEKIKNKYFDLLEFNKQQAQNVFAFESELQQKNNDLIKLESELTNLKSQLFVAQEENARLVETLNQAKREFDSQIENISKSNQVDFKGIVREIDECINLVKNNL